MEKIVSENIKNGISDLLLDKKLKFFQTCDILRSQVLESLVSEAKLKLPMSAEQAIILHKAVLIKEFYYGNDPALVEQILKVLQDVKKEEVFRKYLLTIPEEAVKYRNKVSTLSFFIAEEDIQRWKDNIETIINNFLEQ